MPTPGETVSIVLTVADDSLEHMKACARGDGCLGCPLDNITLCGEWFEQHEDEVDRPDCIACNAAAGYWEEGHDEPGD